MKSYKLKFVHVDSVELKCLLISHGVKVDKSVYKWAKGRARLDVNPLCCNCMILSCGTIVQLADTQFYSQKLSIVLKLFRNANDTPFTLRIKNDKPILFYEKEAVDEVSFPPASNFYHQHTSLGSPYFGNAEIQGLDWVVFMDNNLLPKDLYEILSYAIKNDGVHSLQIVSTNEVIACLDIIEDVFLEEVILDATSQKDESIIDLYFEMGASRVSHNLGIWDMSRENYLQMLENIAQKHGLAKILSNFVIGMEAFDSLATGASWLAERGILPTASVQAPTGKPALELDYYRRTKEYFAELYVKYGLEPPDSKGFNVCIARDIWNYSRK